MTKQETFDTIVNHLRKQGCRAVAIIRGEPGCAYRTPEGRKCAAGCLIPDESYDSDIEMTVVDACSTEGQNSVTQLILSLGHDIQLVKRMQLIHDCHEFENWEKSFVSAAMEFGVNYVPPNSH